MRTRSALLVLAGLLSIFILAGGALSAVLAWQLFRSDNGRSAEVVVLDAERRLQLLDENGTLTVLADDASSEPFRFPAVSPDGRFIAYISLDADGFVIRRLDLHSSETIDLYRSAQHPPLYLVWSPDGTMLSFLSNRSDGLGTHLVAADGSSEAELISVTAGTAYFAWHPESARLLLHTGGSVFQSGQLTNFERGESQPTQLRADPGLFQSPAWSIDGRGFFYVAQPPISDAPSLEVIESVLTRVDADGTNPQALASEKQAAMFFLRAPQSDRLAYTTAGADGFGALKILDDDGSVRTLSRTGEQVAAFFWAPDGRQIAYLSVDGTSATPLTWHLVASDGSALRDLASFAPSQAFGGMITYFDAYAQALDLWSPDSRQLVYAAQDGIYRIDIASGSVERSSDGIFAAWRRR
jgi:Tol biopolymer transport system component